MKTSDEYYLEHPQRHCPLSSFSTQLGEKWTSHMYMVSVVFFYYFVSFSCIIESARALLFFFAILADKSLVLRYSLCFADSYFVLLSSACWGWIGFIAARALWERAQGKQLEYFFRCTVSRSVKKAFFYPDMSLLFVSLLLIIACHLAQEEPTSAVFRVLLKSSVYCSYFCARVFLAGRTAVLLVTACTSRKTRLKVVSVVLGLFMSQPCRTSLFSRLRLLTTCASTRTQQTR